MNLKYQALTGVFWTFLGTVGTGIVSFLLTIILARVLTPSDYGLLELLTVFTILSAVFVDCGFSQAIIKDKNASDEDLSSVFFLNLSIACVIYSLLFIISPFIADFYQEERLVDLSRLVFLVVIFDSMTIIQNANYAKNMQFKPQSIATMISMIFAGIVAIILAFKGFGVWALAINLVLYSFMKMILFWAQSKWYPQLTFSIKSIKKYFSFGVNLLIQGLVDKFVSNLESLLIGRFYVKSELGNFSQSRKLDSYIAQTTTSVIQKVSYPTLAQLDTLDTLKSGYRRIISITMFFMFPLIIFSALFAEDMILVFFGEQWLKAVPYFRIWCICGLLISYYQIFINIFLVKGKTRLLLYVSLIRQILRIISIILLIKLSVMSLLVGILVVTFLSCVIYVITGGKLINYTFKEIISDIWQIATYTIVSLVLSYSTSLIINGNGVFIDLFIQATITIITYLFLMYCSKNKTFKDVLGLLGTLKQKDNEK